LSQAQILQDVLYYADTGDTTPWLICYISRPLVGIPEQLIVQRQADGSLQTLGLQLSKSDGSTAPPRPKKRDIKNFNDLLNQFPMIARQVQPGLERLLQQFNTAMALQSVDASGLESLSASDLNSSDHATSNGSALTEVQWPSSQPIGADRALVWLDNVSRMKQALESVVISAVHLFQRVDKQQLSVLGASTNLSGSLVERMIERHVTEQVHDNLLFPRICAIRHIEDMELEDRIRQVLDVDVSQVGIVNERGQKGRRQLALRIRRGVETFNKIGVAGSPQEMIEILLATERSLTSIAEPNPDSEAGVTQDQEKLTSATSTNADTLVSLLLLVVIRSQVRHLRARLTYMRDFMFINDAESGETGYAISTFEAVLSYLANNSGGLRRASRANHDLWQATKKGDNAIVRKILEPDRANLDDDPIYTERNAFVQTKVEVWDDGQQNGDCLHMNGNIQKNSLLNAPGRPQASEEISLAHVFPFQRQDLSQRGGVPKLKKRVSMEARSMSSSSGQSFGSRISTIRSRLSNAEDEASVDQLVETQDPAGNSILMMAIEKVQSRTLDYFLGLNHLFPLTTILEEDNNEKTTLLSAAVQVGDRNIVTSLLNFIQDNAKDGQVVETYLKRQDSKGRSVAHYLYNAPYLIPSLGGILPWKLRDQNGQTPLFALCRSYDHEHYRYMVEIALSAGVSYQGDGEPLHLDQHTDNKGNTLLHIVHDPRLLQRLLYHCDADPNATNDKHFTPLMMASKFARVDSVRTFFGDPRVDLQARDYRGLTAVELAKDDEVRNRIDDMVLLSTTPGADGRTTTVVRSFFVDDGSVRLIIKSGARNSRSSMTVTTCRRSLTDFENLARWLSLEHPASWMPSILNFRSPYQVPSRPSRVVLRDIQLRLDSFLKTLLSHSTFGTHEMLWEFFLVPDIDTGMLAERTKKKAETRVDKLREEYEPIIDDVSEVELFVSHARDQVWNVHHAFKSLFRRVNAIRNISSDLAEAQHLSSITLSALLPAMKSHLTSYTRYTATLTQTESSPLTQFHYTLLSTLSSSTALLHALSRPASLIGSLHATQDALAKHTAAASRSQRWPSALGLLDDTRARLQQESEEKVDKARRELRSLGCELKYTQQTVAGELAGWQERHAKEIREALRGWAWRMVVVEKERLAEMKRAIREVKGAGSSD